MWHRSLSWLARRLLLSHLLSDIPTGQNSLACPLEEAFEPHHKYWATESPSLGIVCNVCN